MFATVTVKGQVTLPKPIRDKLKIEQGTQLDFTVNADGSILIRPQARSAMAIVGLLKGAARGARSIDEMNEAVADGAAERHARTTRSE